MKKLVMMIAFPVLAVADSFTGSGLVETTPDWFSAYESLFFGEGTLKVSGGAAVFAGPATFNASTGYKATTVDVDAGSSLALSGGVTSTSASIVKTGAGTLIVKDGVLNASGAVAAPSVDVSVQLAWDGDGKVVKGAVPRGIGVHEGTFRIENDSGFKPYAFHVGQLGGISDPTLEIVNSRSGAKFSMYVAANASTNVANTAPTSSLVVKDSVLPELYDFMIGHLGSYSAGNNVHSKVLIDNSQVTNTYRVHLGAHNGVYDFVVSNKSALVNMSADSGVFIGAGQQCTTGAVQIVDHSSLYTTLYSLMNVDWSASNRLVVADGSTLGYTFSLLSVHAPRHAPVLFDGGTLSPWHYQAGGEAGATPADVGRKVNAGLFNEWNEVCVGNGGMTLKAPPHSYASVWAPIRRQTGADDARIDVKGGGQFAISATDVPISVDEDSTLSFGHARYLGEARGVTMVPNRYRTYYVQDFSNDSIVVASGSKLRVRGDDYCLSKMVLPACDITFEGGGLMDLKNLWGYTQQTRCNLMGDDSFVVDNGIECGSTQAIHLKQKIDVTRSFRITFDYYNAAFAGRNVQGFAAFIHNDSRGTAAVGSNMYGLSYGTTNTTGGTYIDKSVAMAVTTWSTKQGHSFVRNGRIDYKNWTSNSSLGQNFTPDRDCPAVGEIVYDAVNHTFTYWLHAPYGKVNAGWSNAAGAKRTDLDWNLTRTVSDVNLEDILGASSGYFGLSAGSDGGSRNQHAFANVSVAYLDEPYETARPDTFVDGILNLGSSTAKLNVIATDTDAGYRMGELRFADGGTLNISGTNVYHGAENAGFVAFDTWTGAGVLNKTGAGNLGMTRQSGTSAALKLKEGGLVLRRDDEDAYTVNTNSSDWIGVNMVRSESALNERTTPTYTGNKGVWVGVTDSCTSGGLALRRRLRVSGKWRLSCDVDDTGSGAYGALFTFHNDPRGCRAYNGHCAYGSGAVADDGSGLQNYTGQDETNKVRNAFGLQFYTYHYGATTVEKAHRVRFFTQSAAGESKVTSVYLTDPQMYCAAVAYKGCDASLILGRKFHLDLEFDESRTNPLKVTMRQTQQVDGTEGTERIWTREYAYNVKTLTGGGDFANFTIFFGCGGSTTRARIDNFRFEHFDQTETAETPYFNTVDVTAPNPVVYLDAATNYVYRLANRVNVSDALIVRSLRAAGTLDLGTPTIDSGAVLTADGATISISGKAGVDKNAELAVAHGGKLKLDFSGALRVKSLTVDGTKYEKGVFNAETLSSALTGPGAIQIGGGLTILIR